MIDTIVLSGGGMKGLGQLGVLHYLHYNNMIENVHTFISTSIGVIISYLVCIGYTPLDIITRICTNGLIQQLSQIDISSAVLGSGAIDTSNIIEFIEELTLEKLLYIPTMKDLSEMGYTFVGCTYNFTEGKIRYISTIDDPDLCITKMIQMCITIPFIFKPCIIDGICYVDGAFSNNFPINLIRPFCDYTRVLGINVCGYMEPLAGSDNCIKPNLSTIMRLMNIPLQADVDRNCKHIPEKSIIHLDIPTCDLLDFNMNTTDKLNTFDEGYKYAEQHYNTHKK